MTTTKYAVYHPKSGKTIFFDSAKEAIENFWKIMLEVSLPLFHNTCYMVVEEKEDGTKVWKNDANDEINRPKTREEITQMLKSLSGRALPAIQVTKL